MANSRGCFRPMIRTKTQKHIRNGGWEEKAKLHIQRHMF